MMLLVDVLTTVASIVLMLVAFVIAFTLQLLAAPFAFAFLSRGARLTLMGTIFRYTCYVFVVALNPFWAITCHFERAKPRGRAIVMCNHMSNSDPFFLSAALVSNSGWETKYVSKSSIFSVPFGGWAMRLAGDLEVKFTSAKGGWGTAPGSVRAMMTRAKALLLEDELMIAVFPEGARSRLGELQPFKDGFFTLAIETQTPVVPCAMAGSRDAWAPGKALMSPAHVHVGRGEPIHPNTGEGVESFKARVRAAIAELTAQMKEKAHAKA